MEVNSLNQAWRLVNLIDCPICEEQFYELLLCCLDSVMGVLKSASLGYPLWICKCQRGCAHCVRKFAEYISDSAHNN